MRIGVRPSLEKVHILSLVQTPTNLPRTFLGSKGEPPTIEQNANVERLLFNSVIDRFGSQPANTVRNQSRITTRCSGCAEQQPHALQA